jgi:hypothetical protein
MWLRWFKSQCVSVGWYSKWGFYLTGKRSKNYGWNRVRTVLQKIKIGDYMVVALPGHCIGRLGQVTGKAIEDTDWEPLVPPTETNKRENDALKKNDRMIGATYFCYCDFIPGVFKQMPLSSLMVTV